MYAAGHPRNAALGPNEAAQDPPGVSAPRANGRVPHLASYPRSPQVQVLTVPTRPLGQRKQGLFGQQAPCPLSLPAPGQRPLSK